MKKMGMVFVSLAMMFSMSGIGYAVSEAQVKANAPPPSVLEQIDAESSAFLEEAVNGVVMIIREEAGQLAATGSGVIVDAQGHVLTNAHVVGDAEKVLVILKNKRRMKGVVMDTDTAGDLALLQLNPEYEDFYQEHFLTMGDSDTLRIGQQMWAIGHPFSFEWTVTKGIISFPSRDPAKYQLPSSGVELPQTDAPVNPGNSGGPLINWRKEVMALNTLIWQGNRGGNIGLAFSVSSNDMRAFYRKALGLDSADVQEPQPIPWLGVSFRELFISEFEKVEELGIATLNSFLIVDMLDGPAYEAGVRKEDIVWQIDGREFLERSDAATYIRSRAVGDTLTLFILRKGVPLRLEVVLSEMPENPESIPVPAEPTVWLGIDFSVLQQHPEIFAEAKKQYSGTEAFHFLISKVVKDSPADKAKLKAGDIIMNFDGKTPAGTQGFVDHLKTKQPGDRLALIVIRGERSLPRFVILEKIPAKK